MCKLLPEHRVQEHLIPRHILLKSIDEWQYWIPCTFIAMKVFTPLTHNEQSNIYHIPRRDASSHFFFCRHLFSIFPLPSHSYFSEETIFEVLRLENQSSTKAPFLSPYNYESIRIFCNRNLSYYFAKILCLGVSQRYFHKKKIPHKGKIFFCIPIMNENINQINLKINFESVIRFGQETKWELFQLVLLAVTPRNQVLSCCTSYMDQELFQRNSIYQYSLVWKRGNLLSIIFYQDNACPREKFANW